MKWKIFYSDGSTFSDKDGKPWEAPKRKVQIISVEDGRCGRRILKFADYYVWSSRINRWVECVDATSAILRMLTVGEHHIVAGEYLREADFERILIQAHEDTYVPSFSPDELSHIAWRK